jgi:ferrous iron transport protein B
MLEQTIHLHPSGSLVALVGNPNCGKTALFNLLTRSRQKVANYAGVTVERKEGRLDVGDGKTLRVLDLPGTYSLYPRSQDERITCDVLMGRAIGEKRPDVLVCVVDATNLRRGLRLVLAVKRMGLPCVVALNMADMATQRGLHIDTQALSEALGLPVVSSVAVQTAGDTALRDWLAAASWRNGGPLLAAEEASVEEDHRVVQDILRRLHLDQLLPDAVSDRLDRVFLHPLWGPLMLSLLLFLIFQAVFSWAAMPMDAIKSATAWTAEGMMALLPDTWWRSLITDGLIAGLGGVVIFLPQILILFFFILLLEESGYLPRAAFLLDRIMGSVGLSGRSFIPLLSSFACAIPGIMATRTIANPRDRMVTILIAPLMTCSARLPV